MNKEMLQQMIFFIRRFLFVGYFALTFKLIIAREKKIKLHIYKKFLNIFIQK